MVCSFQECEFKAQPIAKSDDRMNSTTRAPGATILSAILTLLFAAMGATCADPPNKKSAEVNKPTIEFKDEMVFGDQKAKASFTLIIKLDGTETEKKIKITFTGGSITADFAILTIKSQLGGAVPKSPPSQWKYEADDANNRLILEGWTDPKTQKFHPVKSIKFESPEIPKKFWPTIKMPPNL